VNERGQVYEMSGTRTTPDPVARHRAFIYDLYGGAIGRPVAEVATPALLLDLAAAERNISRMANAMDGFGTAIRPHIKVHKSIELARLQVGAGAAGLSTATVWEACALAWGGLDDIFIVNTVTHPEKLRVLAALAREHRILVAVDDADNAGELAAAAKAAGSQVGVLIEVDTGMDRAGVDTIDEALALAKDVAALDHLRLEGLTGYEGHCSLEPDEQLRTVKHRAAMELLLIVADRLESVGYPCPIRSAGGTATWKLSARTDGVTEIQAGTYVVMDNFHGRMVPDFEPALTVATSVISRPPGRLIVDAGNKSVGIGGGPSLVGTHLEVLRFDEEHGVFVAGPEVDLPVGAWLTMVPGYAPATVNMYDAYHVVKENRVVDVWPVFPRGPGHNGLLAAP
jgi:D-serine deaminase-like pyridoxal phosphate-dependent protein